MTGADSGHDTVAPSTPGDVPADLQGDLPGDDLPAESRAVLELLAAGRSLGEAAAVLHLSRRTTDRRLAQARRALGVATTAQAIALLHEGTSAGAAAESLPRLIGRDDELRDTIADLAADLPVLVVGEGGVGKTALLRAAVAADGRATHMLAGSTATRWKEFGPLGPIVGADALVGDVEAVAALVERAVGPDVLLVDDLHLVDAQTVAVLAALSGRVTVISATRATPGEGIATVEALEAAGFSVRRLDVLGDEATAALALSLAPSLEPDRVDEIVSGAAGLPLIVELLCGAAPGVSADRGLVPSIDALTSTEFDTALLLAASNHPLAVDDGSDELLSAGIALVGPDGRMRIRHQLVADAILAAARDDAIAAAHRHLAEVAEDPGEAARHWQLAGESDASVRYALLGAATATSASERGRLLMLAAESCQDDRSESLWLDAAEALSTAGSHGEARAAVGHLDLDGLEREDVGRAQLVLARSAWHLGDAAAAVAAAGEGRRAVEGSGTRVEARLLLESVRCEVLSTGIADDHDERLARASSIIGEGPGRGSLLNVAATLSYFRDGGGLREWEAGLAAAQAEGDIDTFMRCANNIIMWNEASGDQSASLALAERMSAEARALGLRSWQLQFTTAAANLRYHRARYDEAMALLDQVEYGVLDERTKHQAVVVRAAILIDTGMLEAARHYLGARPGTQAQDWLADDGTYYLHAAWDLAAGRPREALRLIDDFDQRARTESSMWTFLLPIRAWAQHDLGVPVSDHDESSPIPLISGLLVESHAVARLADDPATAMGMFDEAAALGRTWSMAQGLRAQWGAAEAARLAGVPDAVDRLIAVEVAASDLLMEPLLARIHRSLRLSGVSRKARRAPDRSGLLTERERTVLDLIADGASYAEVARRLGVGRPTVRRILGNAQRKLGADSRLAAVAAGRTS